MENKHFILHYPLDLVLHIILLQFLLRNELLFQTLKRTERNMKEYKKMMIHLEKNEKNMTLYGIYNKNSPTICTVHIMYELQN